jgi:hypothetical protein
MDRRPTAWHDCWESLGHLLLVSQLLLVPLEYFLLALMLLLPVLRC